LNPENNLLIPLFLHNLIKLALNNNSNSSDSSESSITPSQDF